jgi:NAD/NADP transhydrogenase alpha subunit
MTWKNVSTVKYGSVHGSVHDGIDTMTLFLNLSPRSELIFGLHPPATEFNKFKDKMLVNWVGRMLPTGKETIAKANAEGVALWDTTAAPRITIAQKLDVLSSQAKVAGHRAVIEAAHLFERFHSPEITASGK